MTIFSLLYKYPVRISKIVLDTDFMRILPKQRLVLISDTIIYFCLVVSRLAMIALLHPRPRRVCTILSLA